MSAAKPICQGPNLETVSARSTRTRQDPHLPPPEVLGKHPGEWVAIVNRRIVAAGVDFRKVLSEGRLTAHGKEPSMFRVPTGEILLL